MNNFGADETGGEGLARLVPALVIVLMTVASWVGVFVVLRGAVDYAPSAQSTSVETISDSMGGR